MAVGTSPIITTSARITDARTITFAHPVDGVIRMDAHF